MGNLIKTAFGTPVVWTDTGGDKLLDLGGLAANGVVMGSFLDLGISPRTTKYKFEFLIDGFDTAPVVDDVVSLRFSQSDATTNFDGNPTTDPTTTAQGTMTVAQLVNLRIADVCSVYSTTAADELKITGYVELTGRYVSPVVHNQTADALLSTSDAHSLTLTPMTDDIQATA